MTVPSRTIIDLIATPPTVTSQGRAAFRLNQMKTQAQRGLDGGTPAQRSFMDSYATQTLPPQREAAHPAVRAPYRKPGPLTPSDIAWLQRFPSPVDPAAVSFQDARALASLDESVSPLEHAADSRLIRSVWAPVREYHDRKSADAAMANAQQPLPPVPTRALEALSDSVAAETPQLNRDEATARARTMLADATKQREQARAHAIAAAEEQARGLDLAEYGRTVVNPATGARAASPRLDFEHAARALVADMRDARG